MLGVDPRRWTLRGLAIAAGQRRLEEWDRTAAIVAAVFNKWNSKPQPSRTFNPYRVARDRESMPTITAAEMGRMMGGE